MAPKAKINREAVLNTVLTITRESGFHAVNARSIAGRLQCSTRPIFTCYENMTALKKDFLDFAYAFYEQYVAAYRERVRDPRLVLPLSYIQFAREETHLFQLLFVHDMDLHMTNANDFYREIGNENKAQDFSETIGVSLAQGKAIFLDLFLYSHGIAVLTATGKLSFPENQAERLLANFLSALILRGNPAPISKPDDPC